MVENMLVVYLPQYNHLSFNGNNIPSIKSIKLYVGNFPNHSTIWYCDVTAAVMSSKTNTEERIDLTVSSNIWAQFLRPDHMA